MMRRTFSLLLILLAALPAAVGKAQRPARFVARLQNGASIEGEVLANWHTADATPTLDGRPLGDAGNPLRWLRDRQLTAANSPEAFVELFSGDRLPGVALEYRESASGSPEQVVPHWLVRPAIAQRPPQALDEPLVRVQAPFVRRIVWQRRHAASYRPGTVLLRDGSSRSFRSVRFEGEQALLLLATGLQRIRLTEMAELHLPAHDFWQDYFDELAVLSPNPGTRLMQLETDDGLIATTSLDRFTVFAWGGSEHWRNWAHGIQPAWALDVLFIPSAKVVIRRLFAPHEVLLSRIPPRLMEDGEAAPASAWPPQVNRNVLGGRLYSGQREFGWGFGVQAFSQLRFPLTPLAAALQTELGLDRTVGTGGCAQGRVRIGSPASSPVFESDLLVGSAQVQASGRLALPVRSESPGELVLEVDPAHQKRPPGADPLNIRDCANWLEPVLELHSDRLGDEIRQRVTRQFPAWNDWTVSWDGQVAWPSVLCEIPGRPAAFLRGVSVAHNPLTLRRRLKLDPRTPWLLLSVGQDRAPRGRPRVQLSLDGDPVLDREVPFSDNWRNLVNPLVVPLRDHVRTGPREVQVEIRQIPGEQQTPVYWQGLVAVERLPMLQEVFEDQGRFVATPWPATAEQESSSNAPSVESGAGEPAVPDTLVTEDKQSGRQAVKLPAGACYHLTLRGSLAIRERPAWGEFRFLRFAFRKQGAGRICLQLDHRQRAERPASYDAGSGAPCLPLARRVQTSSLSDEWTIITRDVFADFGPLDIEGITLAAPDGQHVLFDQIYLARTVDDFQYLAELTATSPAVE